MRRRLAVFATRGAESYLHPVVSRWPQLRLTGNWRRAHCVLSSCRRGGCTEMAPQALLALCCLIVATSGAAQECGPHSEILSQNFDEHDGSKYVPWTYQVGSHCTICCIQCISQLLATSLSLFASPPLTSHGLLVQDMQRAWPKSLAREDFRGNYQTPGLVYSKGIERASVGGGHLRLAHPKVGCALL